MIRDDGTDKQLSVAADLPHGHTLVEEKWFHHGNLRLQLLHDTTFDVYSINVHRRNDRSNHDLWGIWVEENLDVARAKFEAIRL